MIKINRVGLWFVFVISAVSGSFAAARVVQEYGYMGNSDFGSFMVVQIAAVAVFFAVFALPLGSVILLDKFGVVEVNVP